MPPAAKEYSLALTGIPNDKHYGEQCETAFANLILSAPTVEINHEYKSGSVDHVQVRSFFLFGYSETFRLYSTTMVKKLI